jgi:hypothetical protein
MAASRRDLLYKGWLKAVARTFDQIDTQGERPPCGRAGAGAGSIGEEAGGRPTYRD